MYFVFALQKTRNKRGVASGRGCGGFRQREEGVENPLGDCVTPSVKSKPIVQCIPSLLPIHSNR